MFDNTEQFSRRSSDIVFITNLKSALLQESLNLLEIPNAEYPESVANMERIIQIILIVVSVILAALCCSLIVAYCIKTRSLNRQLKALSATDFGSTESNLNRREAPTTNVFSVEGSNPVLNHSDLDKGMFDNMSVDSESSDDSDFVGLDNDLTFAPNGKRVSRPSKCSFWSNLLNFFLSTHKKKKTGKYKRCSVEWNQR